MRDLDDVRAAFDVLERRADAHLDSGGGRSAFSVEHLSVQPISRTGRRWPTAAAVALVAAAAVVIALVADRPAPARHVTGSGSHEAPAYPSLPLRSLVFRLEHQATMTTTYAAGEQQSATYTDSSGLTYTITAHAQDAPLPYEQAGAVPLIVRGRPGVYGLVEQDGPEDGDQGVAWQYGPGEWATVRGDYGEPTRQQAVAIARAVIFEPQPLRTPLAVRLPSARLRDWFADSDDASVLMRVGGHDVQVALRPTPAARTADATTVNGRTAYWSSGRTVLSVVLTEHESMTVFAMGGGARQARAAALASTPSADPHDPSTWFDATAVLPGR